MKKLNFWLFASLFVAAFTLSACGDDEENNEIVTPPNENVEVNSENLKGIWDGFVEADFAQGYYQRWKIYFDGDNYTTWHTHLTAGSINDDVQGLKTVGNKEQGTWKYENGKLVLTPTKQWASYYQTAKSLNDPYYYVYYNYNPETMEADQWYETPDILIQNGIERDQKDNTDWYIQKWPVVSLTKTALSIRINRDVFKLDKQ